MHTYVSVDDLIHVVSIDDAMQCWWMIRCMCVRMAMHVCQCWWMMRCMCVSV